MRQESGLCCGAEDSLTAYPRETGWEAREELVDAQSLQLFFQRLSQYIR